MRRFIMLLLAGTTLLFTGLAWAQKQTGSRRPNPVIRSAPAQRAGVRPLTVSNGNVTPTAITFTSSTPDNTQTNNSTKVSFTVTGNPAAFHVYAVAGAANFTGCNTPPVSSITATCGTPVGVTCAAAAPLTNAAAGTTVATGSGNHATASFIVTLTFQDAWNYSVGATCQNTLQYYYSEP